MRIRQENQRGMARSAHPVRVTGHAITATLAIVVGTGGILPLSLGTAFVASLPFLSGCGGGSGSDASLQSTRVKFMVQWANIADPAADRSRATVLQASRAARSVKITLDGGAKGAFTETFDRTVGDGGGTAPYESRSRVNLSGSLLGNSDPNFTVTIEFFSQTGGAGESVASYPQDPTKPIQARVDSGGNLILPGGDTVPSEGQNVVLPITNHKRVAGLAVTLAEGSDTVASGIVKRVRVRLNGKDLGPRAAKITSSDTAIVEILPNKDRADDTYLVLGKSAGTASIVAEIDGVKSPLSPITVKSRVEVLPDGISSAEGNSLPITTGSTRQFSARVNTADTGETGAVKWKIISGDDASIDENSGLLTVQSAKASTPQEREVVLQATSALDPAGWASTPPPELEPNRNKTTPRQVTVRVVKNRFVSIKAREASGDIESITESPSQRVSRPASSSARPQQITFRLSASDNPARGIKVELVGGATAGAITFPPNTADDTVPNGSEIIYTAPTTGGTYVLRAINTNDQTVFAEMIIVVEAANVGAIIK